jgi:uncharacterized membrane protein
MINIIKLSIIVLLLDSIFLYFIKNLFGKQIFAVQNSELQVNFIGAAICYFFIILSLYWFIIKDKKNLKDAFILGLCIYAVYEYTNYALLKNWNFKTTIIDTLWGGTLFTLSTYLYYNLKILN